VKPCKLKIGDIIELNYTSAISDFYGERVLCEPGDLALVINKYLKTEPHNDITWKVDIKVFRTNEIIKVHGVPSFFKKYKQEDIVYMLYGKEKDLCQEK